MSTNRPCLCCLVRNSDKSLKARNTWLGNIEVYGEMLKECFEISIEHEEDSGICTICVIRLRDALEFKNQIIQCQQDLHKNINIANVKDEVKSEGSIEALEEEFFDDYLPEFGSDAEAGQGNEEGDKDDVKPLMKNQQPSQSTPKTKTVTRPVLKAKTKVEGKKSGVKKVDAEKVLKDIKERKDLVVKKTIKGQETTKAETTRTESRNNKQLKFIKNYINRPSHLDYIMKYSNCTPFRHRSTEGYHCAFCTEIFFDPKYLREHTHKLHRLQNSIKLRRQTPVPLKIDITDFTCNICSEKINNIKLFLQHIQDTHKKRLSTGPFNVTEFKLKPHPIYDCVQCNSTYETFKMLLQHMNSHYNNYVCDTCGKGFANNQKLRSHITTHATGEFVCKLCSKVFPTQVKRTSHIKFSHKSGKIKANCSYCKETFTNYHTRNQHVVKQHNIKTPYICNICDREFLLKSYLMKHTRVVHLNERSHFCKECGHGFNNITSLKNHMLKHTGERKYKCDVCNKCYGRRTTLVEHMRIHNNDRRFKCHVCGMDFVQKCSLKGHLLSKHEIKLVYNAKNNEILRNT